MGTAADTTTYYLWPPLSTVHSLKEEEVAEGTGLDQQQWWQTSEHSEAGSSAPPAAGCHSHLSK